MYSLVDRADYQYHIDLFYIIEMKFAAEKILWIEHDWREAV